MDFNWYDAIPGVGPVDMAWQGGKQLFDSTGLPTQYPDRNQIMQQINAGLGRQAPTVDTSQSDYWRSLQQQNAQNLMGIASGQKQGAGELAAQRQVQNAIAGQQGMANMARGGANAGMAFRQAARNQAGIGLAGAGQAQQAALGDQQMAYGQLNGLMQGARGQDQANAFANQNAQMGQQQAWLQYLSQLTGMDANQLAAQVAAKQSQNQLLGGLVGQAGQIGATAAMASDERLKTDISDAGDETDEMLRSIMPKRYTYKDQGKHGVGSRVGIMAQDLERSKAGRDVVRNTAGGKMLDVNAAISAALAGVGRLDERLRKVEGK